jgi:hypothetical protein
VDPCVTIVEYNVIFVLSIISGDDNVAATAVVKRG